MNEIVAGDTLGAFVRENHIEMPGADMGPLTGLTFAAKDIYDVAGAKTGFGCPDWLRTHGPAARTAPAVQMLLDAGAHLVGKTHTEEMAWSLTGENAHYGTPVNVNAPGRVPGGSSSGSAAAVAAGLVDFALGSDTGGSVRLPASYCGILGMRPTHGRISLEGVCPLAPSFDTCGWFARDASVFERVGRVLLCDAAPARTARRLLMAQDAFAFAEAAAVAALKPALGKAAALIGVPENVTIGDKPLENWMDTFRFPQGAEAAVRSRDPGALRVGLDRGLEGGGARPRATRGDCPPHGRTAPGRRGAAIAERAGYRVAEKFPACCGGRAARPRAADVVHRRAGAPAAGFAAARHA
jgi:amidase